MKSKKSPPPNREKQDREVMININIHIDVHDAKTGKHMNCFEKQYDNIKEARKDLLTISYLEK